MFRNYLAAALRNMSRAPLYAVINILGLSVGMAAALLIALFVRDELSFDTWIPGYQNVYRLQFAQHAPKILPGVRDIRSNFAIQRVKSGAPLPLHHLKE